MITLMQTFLAGKPVFKADVVEIWAIAEAGAGAGDALSETGHSDYQPAASVTGFSDIGVTSV